MALILLLVMSLGLNRPADAADPVAFPPVDESLVLQRGIYLQARDALNRGRNADYDALREQLAGYPLLPYLEYAAISSILSRLPQREVDIFLQTYAGSYLANLLERQWVGLLAQQERWSDIVRYPDAGATTVLRCQVLRARIETGDTSALDEVAPLWNVARSQPNECDPVFSAWTSQNLLTTDIAWARFSSAIRAGEQGLARFITRSMGVRERELADLYLLIDRQPERLKTLDALQARNPETQEIVMHGVRRLAMIDAPQAMQLLDSHQQHQSFDEAEYFALQRFIAQRLLSQGFVGETESLIQVTPQLATETLVGWLLRDALKAQDWPRLEALLERLPSDAKESERWRYWRARALEQHEDAESLAQAQAIYESLIRTRSFYGFLAADRQEESYTLVDQPVAVDSAQILALYELPAIMRAYELYQTGDEVAARNEWQHATRSMSPEQVLSSGKLADSWGWHRNSIQAMIQAGHWDDLQLRFPLAYSDLFTTVATTEKLSPHFLLALTRQESAFMHDVRSPAGARGLMQLMPATARQTAGRLGLQISDQDLYQPDINIRLGSRYMAELMQDFNGNRVLAAAAYNAGPNRVKQWLRNSNGTLPVDIWIETIPFAETRGYVQNVLAYSVIYGYRMGEYTRFLSREELDAML